MNQQYRMCTRCVMDTTDPEIEFNEQELLQYCRKHSPPYMVPKAFELHQELPKNASGKLDRSLIKQRVFDSLETAVGK